MKGSNVFEEFYENAKGGILLIICTILSLLIAQSSLSDGYLHFWNFKLGGLSLTQWVNDGLMAIFFLMIGLELKREVYVGELSNINNATLPLFAAIGGMIIPASIFMILNYGTPTQAGAGIPMATDIAFAIGVLSLLGNKVPSSLKIFLMAIAVIDDLGAIIVIALFYTSDLSLLHFLIVIGLFGGLLILNKLKIKHLSVYLILGIFMWYFMLKSGVHATLAGILLAIALPFEKGSKSALSYKIQDALDEPVALIILPVFALANTAIVFAPGWDNGLLTMGSMGIFAGLIIGKPIGVILFSFLAVTIGVSSLPRGLQWKHVIGVGFLAGIGFTMSIFITLLAYTDETIITESKISILLASLTSGIIGFTWLRNILKNPSKKITKKEPY
ncbi:MAG: Na+/H+ antiporter NhaA [Ginsengibacter sp.]|jgi:NhaA family Na+:H+ antiporter